MWLLLPIKVPSAESLYIDTGSAFSSKFSLLDLTFASSISSSGAARP